MAASLRLLAALPGRSIAVLGDMLELGPDEDRWHAEAVQLALDLGLAAVFVSGPRMARAAATLDDPRLHAAEDGLQLVEPLRAALVAGDRVLFKGSRGARVERILHAVRGDDIPEGAH